MEEVFEWDEGNRHKSATKHKIATVEAESVWRDKNKVLLESTKSIEKRYLCIGISEQSNLLTNVFCIRDEKIRIISSRKANKGESKAYHSLKGK